LTQTPPTGRNPADDGVPGVGARSRSVQGEDDLQASLAALSRLSTGRLNLEDLLVRVATFAVRAIPGADGAGLTMLERDRADTIVASAPFVSEIDAIQYGAPRDRPVELLRLGTDDTRLVQDMLPGDEYSIDVFADMAGTVVAAVPGSRCSSPRWSADVEPRDAHPERHAGRHDDVTDPGH